MRTENRVVMLTDIEGFTAATSRQTREENARMLALHDALLMPVIEAYGGDRVKTIGDAYLVLFQAPTEALLCAAAIQDRLFDHARRVEEGQRIHVRIALAMGDVRLDAGDVYGEAVNLAARIEGQAASGEIWFSEALYWTLDRSRVPVEELGWRTLDGLQEEVRLFRVARASPEEHGAPYAGIGLDLVAGLAPPLPERLSRQVKVGRRRPSRAPAVRLAAALLGLVVLGGALAWWFEQPPALRAIRLGRFEEARARLDEQAARQGTEAPQVLYLRGRLEAARVEAGMVASARGAFSAWSRAVAAGSDEAVEALRREGSSSDCSRRKLAAHALADARVRWALPALEELAAAEPPAAPVGPIERLRQAVVGDGRCGAGDVAREGIAAIEGSPRRSGR